MTNHTTERLFKLFIDEMVQAPPHARVWLAGHLVKGTEFIVVPKRANGHIRALPAPADVIPLRPQRGENDV